MSLYEAMFVLDNDAVRAGWADAKGIATGILEKHGATVRTARRWDERRLAYSIGGKVRATFLLAFFEAGGDAITAISRDLELDERMLRYLILAAESLPEGEEELSKAEQSKDFLVPEPPPDVEHKPEPEPEPRKAEEKAEEKPEEKTGDKPEEKAEEKAEEKPKAKEKAKEASEESSKSEEKPAEASAPAKTEEQPAAESAPVAAESPKES